MPNAPTALKPFKASYTFTFDALDLACAGKQNRDLLEAAEDLGFVLETAAFGEPGVIDSRGGASVSPRGDRADVPSGESGYETEVRIISRPDVDCGQPMLLAAGGVRVTAITDRLVAGESVEVVAEDFEVDRAEVFLLAQIAAALMGLLLSNAPGGSK